MKASTQITSTYLCTPKSLRPEAKLGSQETNFSPTPKISKLVVFLIHMETSEQPYLHQHHDTGTQKVTSGRIQTNNLHLTGQAVWLYSSWWFSIGQATEIIRQTALRGGKNTGLVYYHHAKSFHRIWVIIISHLLINTSRSVHVSYDLFLWPVLYCQALNKAYAIQNVFLKASYLSRLLLKLAYKWLYNIYIVYQNYWYTSKTYCSVNNLHLTYINRINFEHLLFFCWVFLL